MVQLSLRYMSYTIDLAPVIVSNVILLIIHFMFKSSLSIAYTPGSILVDLTPIIPPRHNLLAYPRPSVARLFRISTFASTYITACPSYNDPMWSCVVTIPLLLTRLLDGPSRPRPVTTYYVLAM